jgi:hypothetical protein
VGWGINIRLQKEDERSKGIRPLAYGNAGITDSGGFVHLSSCSLVRGVPQALAWPHLRGHAGGARGARHRAAVWGQGQRDNGWVSSRDYVLLGGGGGHQISLCANGMGRSVLK